MHNKEKEIKVINNDTTLTYDNNIGCISNNGDYISSCTADIFLGFRIFGDLIHSIDGLVTRNNLTCSDEDFELYVNSFDWPEWAGELKAIHPDIREEDLAEIIVNHMRSAWINYWGIRYKGMHSDDIFSSESTTKIRYYDAEKMLKNLPLSYLMDDGRYLLTISNPEIDVINPDHANKTALSLIAVIDDDIPYVYFADMSLGDRDQFGNFEMDYDYIVDIVRTDLEIDTDIDVKLYPIQLYAGNQFTTCGVTLYEIIH